MGGGTWSDAAYRKSVKGRSAFAYSDDTLSRSRSEWKCHQLLDPYGLKIRESRDSAEHPESNAILTGLDVTGSMGVVVVAVRDSLGKLMDMLLEGKYISDPQILFYAVGDASPDSRRENGMCDTIPFQVSQFESDNRINDQITKVVLEGGGGGQNTESYELGFYCADRHTSIDCFEKRGRKGYLFSIGDELPYPAVSKKEVKKIFNATLQNDVPLAEVVKNAQRKYNIFHIIPKGSNHYNDPDIRNTWAKILGGKQFVFMLEDPDATAETIAVAIALNEGSMTLEDGLKIVAKNSGQKIATVVRKALEDLAEYTLREVKSKPASSKDSKKDSKKKEEKGKKDSDGWKL